MSAAQINVTTPDIPKWVQKIRANSYVNICKVGSRRKRIYPDPSRPNLWGTETLCGDWNGRVLILLKDFASTGWLESRTDGRPYYSHAPDLATNRNLVSLLRKNQVDIDESGSTNTHCGILYASACFLLRDGYGMSANISADALKASWPVVEFTIGAMPNLTDIVLCGCEAYQTFLWHGDIGVSREQALAKNRPILWRKKYRLHVTCHPSPRGIIRRQDAKGRFGWDVVMADWKRVFRYSRKEDSPSNLS